MSKKKEENRDEAVVKENTSQKPDEKAETAEAAEEKDETAEKIAALEEELNLQKEKYLRLCAEYDNYRKRTANEKLSIYDDATAKAVTELLPVADSIQMAITNLKDSDPDILKGIELISNQLAKSLEKLKVEAFGAQGEEFNPEIHNAISKIEDENFEKNCISQVFQTGYRIGDKIIRHAMVQVANCD